jgi:ribosomal protein S18 acetylase RimI-like enzyme
MAQWPYRPDLDIVALTDDGQPVGSAIIWFDDSYDYGELEPVGVASTHRGQGLAAAMLRYGLGRLRAAGATYAVVGARGDDDYPVPRHLYASVGFERFTSQRIVRRR